MSSGDALERWKNQVLQSNKDVAPKAVLVSVAINSGLSVRSTSGVARCGHVRSIYSLSHARFGVAVSYSACV